MVPSPSNAQPLVAPFGVLLRRLLMSRNVSVAVASAQISVRPDVLWRVLACHGASCGKCLNCRTKQPAHDDLEYAQDEAVFELDNTEP